jgi:hypothetical protein
MTPANHLRFFLRQCVYALTVFSVITTLGEWIVPGSVSPYLDPIPLVILSLALLTIDAMA